MTKKTLVEDIAGAMHCSRAKALEFINAYQSIMIERISHAGEFTLQGIGNFKLKTRAARQGRNPGTGESLIVPERKVVNFKASAPLLRLLNT